MAGVINPVTYVRGAAVAVGATWGGSTQPTSSAMTISVPEVSSDDVNPILIFTAQGADWRSGSTNPMILYTDTTGVTVDTDWYLIYSGMPAVHEPLAVYYETNPDISAAHNVLLHHDGTGGVYGYLRINLFDNARQVPSCDTIVGNVQAAHSSVSHNFTVTNYSSDVAWGLISHSHGDFDLNNSITYGSDVTQLWNYRWIQESTFISEGTFTGGWATGDTTTYTIAYASSVDAGQMFSCIWQIYPYEVELQSYAGTLEFSGISDWGRASVMVLDIFEGTLTFAKNWTLRFFRTFESVLQFSSTIGKKTSKYFGGILDLIGHRVDWRFIYQKIKYTIRVWMGSAEQDIGSEVGLSAGSITSSDYGAGDQPTKASINMPWDDPTRRN